MDDIYRNIKHSLINAKLEEINNLHPNLQFTIEREENGSIPFLDMRLIHKGNKLESTWYNKPTDTGLILNYHALAPKRYKRSVVSGFVHRIHRACSTETHFEESMRKAKAVLEKNQYPPSFYGPIIRDTIDEIKFPKESEPSREMGQEDPQSKGRKMVLLQYRGKCTEEYARALHKIKAPCQLVMTLRKLKTVLPSLKPPIEKMIKSGVIYEIQCPRCKSSYVGQTSRHLKTRFAEHRTREGPVKKHFRDCGVAIDDSHISIIGASARGEQHLLTLEALHIREKKPSINTKDEWRQRELTIKL